MLVQFTNTIKYQGLSLDVVFTQIFTVKGTKFFVGIAKDHTHYFVDMSKVSDKWRIEGSVSEWLKDLEPILSDTIVRNLSGQDEESHEKPGE